LIEQGDDNFILLAGQFLPCFFFLFFHSRKKVLDNTFFLVQNSQLAAESRSNFLEIKK